MQIILLTKSGKKTSGVDLCRPAPLGIISLFGGAVCGAMIYLGYLMGMPGIEAENTVKALHKALAEQRMTLGQTRMLAQGHMDNLAIRLGQMQAHIYRLDALGDRLTEMAELDNGEFDFAQAPAQGGPETGYESQSLEVPDFLRLLEDLTQQMEDRERQLRVLEELLLSRNLHDEVFPTGRPVRSGFVSSSYGYRIHPMSGRKEYHKGVDFAGKKGSEIIAVASGVVTEASRHSSYGNLIEIMHGSGYVTRYAHNQKNLVEVGDMVKQGQLIALMGSTGRSTGPHVHFEVIRDGRTVNPTKYIQASR